MLSYKHKARFIITPTLRFPFNFREIKWQANSISMASFSFELIQTNAFGNPSALVIQSPIVQDDECANSISDLENMFPIVNSLINHFHQQAIQSKRFSSESSFPKILNNR